MNFPEAIYTIDILFAVFVFLFAVGGLRRGLSGELASLLTLTVLLFCICFFYPSLTQMAARLWEALPPVLIQVVVLLVLLLGAVLLSFLLHLLLRQVVKSRMGEVGDKVCGVALGMVRGSLIGISLLAVLSLLPSERLYDALVGKSTVGAWVCNTLTPWAHPRLMEMPVFDQEEN